MPHVTTEPPVVTPVIPRCGHTQREQHTLTAEQRTPICAREYQKVVRTPLDHSLLLVPYALLCGYLFPILQHKMAAARKHQEELRLIGLEVEASRERLVALPVCVGAAPSVLERAVKMAEIGLARMSRALLEAVDTEEKAAVLAEEAAV